MEDKRLFLLDAYALIFRAYYALIKNPRMTRDGFNASAIFGFVNTLEEVIRKERPSHLAVCFDPAGPTFRSEAFADYKGERESTPEDIKRSIPIIKEIVKAYRIPILEVEGFEADDVIGTMAKMAGERGFTTYMMTPDKDFGQLVGPDILQYKPSYRGQDFELRGEKEVCERYGISSTGQVIDLLALMGDKVDNIPGCPGVGEKTAVKLISEFGNVDNLIAHAGELKGAMRKRVEENAEQILFSRYLATIRTDVPVGVEPDSLIRREPDTSKLFAIFRELDFRQLAGRVRKRIEADSRRVAQPGLFDFDSPEEESGEIKPAGVSDLTGVKVMRASTPETIREFADATVGADRCGLVILATGDNDMTARWEQTAVALPDGKVWILPADDKETRAALLDLMARPDILKITPAAKRDMVVATNAGADFRHSLTNYFDVTLAHYLLQPEGGHDLENLAAGYLHAAVPQIAVASARKTPDPGAQQEALAMHAAAALALHAPLEAELAGTGLRHLYDTLELPLVPVLADMELTGVRIDPEALRQAAADMEHRLADIEEEIYSMAGVRFNVGSPAKVGEVLFDQLALDPKAKRTKTGQYSTSETVLEKVAHKHPVVGKILEYRQLKKLLNTYLTTLPDAINPATGRVHTNYNQTVTATGRISSSSPNLQNIPVREGEGRGIRRAFIPSEGNLFLSADYSQIELRLAADFAAEQVMLDAFAAGDDIHAATAGKIYHKPATEVTSDERRHAKTANFGILYGITAFGLASRLGIPRGEAKELIDNYFASFPGIRQYMERSVTEARERGYAVTPAGRRRMLPDLRSSNPVVRGFAERNAVNAPIQGAAADIIKRAMITIHQEMIRRNLRSQMTMQVHDELNFDVVPEELAELQNLVVNAMESAYNGRVHLTASCGVAGNWLEAH